MPLAVRTAYEKLCFAEDLRRQVGYEEPTNEEGYVVEIVDGVELSQVEYTTLWLGSEWEAVGQLVVTIDLGIRAMGR